MTSALKVCSSIAGIAMTRAGASLASSATCNLFGSAQIRLEHAPNGQIRDFR